MGNNIFMYAYGAWASVVVKASATVGWSWDRSLEFFSVVTSDKTMCPEVGSSSENEYQGFLLG